MTTVHVSPRGGERLLADIGGTNARFAWQNGAAGLIDDLVTLPCAEYLTLADAIQHYLTVVGRSAPPNCAIAIANPVLGDQVQMTNHHWTFSISALKVQFGFAKLRVLNDFTALALALPALRPEELRQVWGGQPVPFAAIGLVGVGGLHATRANGPPLVQLPLWSNSMRRASVGGPGA